MKKIITTVLAVVLMLTMVFSLASCGTSGKTLAEVKESGKLVVATSPDFPPFENLEGGEVVGIEIDILKEVCKELGVELVIEQMNFDSVLLGIQSAKYDCAASGITVNADREKNMRFTTPYYTAAQSIVVKADSTIATKADLEGKKISAQLGTTAQSYCSDEGYDVSAFEANADALTALETGKVDAWVVDNLTAIQMTAGKTGLKILNETMTEEPYAFAFAYGSEDLVEEIDAIVKDLISSGKMALIFAKYGEIYVAPKA